MCVCVCVGCVVGCGLLCVCVLSVRCAASFFLKQFGDKVCQTLEMFSLGVGLNTFWLVNFR